MLATIIAYTFLGAVPSAFLLSIAFKIYEVIDDWKSERFN